MKTPYHPYSVAYDNPLLRGQEEKRPWNFLEIVKKYASPNKSLLDIGCGTAAKLVQVAHGFGEVIGIEPNPIMLEKAKRRISDAQFRHVQLLEGFAHKIPIENATIDIVTAMMSAQEILEIYRVLKPGGSALIEVPGELDKQLLKSFFIDNRGQPRGQYAYLPKGSVSKLYYEMFNSLFKKVTVEEGFWDSYLTWDGLVELLLQTPTIRNFDKLNDQTLLRKVADALETNEGFKITQHRILIVAKK